MSLLDAFSVADRTPQADPFFRWTGSKAALRETISRRMPARIAGNYLEPFIGGGALALALLSEPGRIAGAALLSDTNQELIITYACVRDCPERVITALEAHKRASSAEHYKAIRAQVLPDLSGHDVRGEIGDAERAARFLYLIGAGWHGLWRVSATGKMNTPYGHGDTHYVEPERIYAASRALSRARFAIMDFEQAIDRCGAGDLIYADPPYIPRTPTASFTAYGKNKFTQTDHERLDHICAIAANRGAHALVSNSDTKHTRRIYAGGEAVTISHKYRIGADRRGADPVREVLIMYRREDR